MRRLPPVPREARPQVGVRLQGEARRRWTRLVRAAGRALRELRNLRPRHLRPPRPERRQPVSVLHRRNWLLNPSSAQNPYYGSVTMGTVSPETLQLTLDDAIQRGIQANLAITQARIQQQQADAQRLESLNAVLPYLKAEASTRRAPDQSGVPSASMPGRLPTLLQTSLESTLRLSKPSWR